MLLVVSEGTENWEIFVVKIFSLVVMATKIKRKIFSIPHIIYVFKTMKSSVSRKSF